MKNNIIILFSIFFICTVLAQAQNIGIRFEKTKWDQVLQKAKKENKMIFLDCYTSWCGPCKWMEKQIYTNDTVADFYNSNFICVKIDMEKDEGFDLAKKYSITNYPTMLYLTGTGEELHRVCGSKAVKDFIEIGRKALNPQEQFFTYKNQFKDGAAPAKIAYQYFELLEGACLKYDSVVEKYFFAHKDSNLTSPDNWKIIYKYTNYTSKFFQYFEAKKFDFYQQYSIDSVEKKINRVYAEALYLARVDRNEKEFDKLKAKFRKLKTKDAERVIQHVELKLEKLPNADLKNALEIEDSIVGPINVSKGFGAVKDFKENASIDESNSAWFKLNINHDTVLTFDIVPIDSLDDYDFAVFKCPVTNSNKNVKSSKINSKPERYCYSYCTSKSGVTGLSRYTTNTEIGAGDGPAYVSGIPVKAGESYYLLIDFSENYIRQHRSPLGFTIYFYNYWPKRRPIVLSNIFFENDKTLLQKESFPELNKLAIRLQKSQIKIEIRGHTDGNGNEKQNQALSEGRAKAVFEYLLSKNIKPDRLFYTGLGSTTPIASNDTEEGRKKNRRVEFVIVMN